MILRIRKTPREHTRFYILLSVLIGLLFIRYGLEIGIPRIVLTGVIAIIALVGNRSEILAIAMCCIPLHAAVDFFYALVACAGIYVLKYHQEIRINLGVIITLAMIFWELLHCFRPEFSLMGFLVSMIPLIFLAVILCIDVSDLDYTFVIRTMAVVLVSTCLILLINLIVRADFNLLLAISGLRRLGEVSENSRNEAMLGGDMNPNTLGIICVLVCTGLLQLWSIGKSRMTDIMCMVILMVFGILTSSRTFLVCLLLMALLLIMAQPGDFRKKFRLSATLLLMAVAALILMNWLFPDVLEYYIKRFRLDDITTGRDTLMIAYHRFISNNPHVMFFGVGLQDFVRNLTEIYRVADNLPHNSIQEIVVAWGIPGMLLFVLLCMMLFRQSGKYCRTYRLLNAIPFLILIVKSMAGQLLTSHYTILALSYAYLSLCQNFEIKKET